MSHTNFGLMGPVRQTDLCHLIYNYEKCITTISNNNYNQYIGSRIIEGLLKPSRKSDFTCSEAFNEMLIIFSTIFFTFKTATVKNNLSPVRQDRSK